MTLSQEQKICLESVYTFLQGATVYLRAVEHVVFPEDVAQLKGLVELGWLCLSRLPEYFPEVREFQRGGVR
jgi:hypothetical protein